MMTGWHFARPAQSHDPLQMGRLKRGVPAGWALQPRQAQRHVCVLGVVCISGCCEASVCRTSHWGRSMDGLHGTDGEVIM
jgi:hypothetical protein